MNFAHLLGPAILVGLVFLIPIINWLTKPPTCKRHNIPMVKRSTDDPFSIPDVVSPPAPSKHYCPLCKKEKGALAD